jgi:urease accessory protein
MYDGASLSDGLQRATGDLRVSVKRRGDLSVLRGLRQAGCLKARFPRPVVPGWCDVTTVNTSGGVVGGDQLRSSISVGEGARATIASQAAERCYRALPGSAPSSVRTTLEIAPDAVAEWLPQETILFDRCSLERRLLVDMAERASFLGVEMLVFGRAAMGERVAAARLRDLIQVWRGGASLLHDAIRLDGEVGLLLQRSALAGGARAIATLVYVCPDAEVRLDDVRAAVSDPGFAASAWNGMLIGRIVADDGASVRRAVVAALAALRGGRPLPRVWLC